MQVHTPVSATHRGPSTPWVSSYGCFSTSLGPILSVLPLPKVLPSWALLPSLQLVSSLDSDPCLLSHFRNPGETEGKIETLGENTGGPRLCGPLPCQHPHLSSISSSVPRVRGPQSAPGKPVLLWVHRLALRLNSNFPSPSKLR